MEVKGLKMRVDLAKPFWVPAYELSVGWPQLSNTPKVRDPEPKPSRSIGKYPEILSSKAMNGLAAIQMPIHGLHSPPQRRNYRR